MVIDILTTLLAVLFQGQHCTYLFHRHVVHDLTLGGFDWFPFSLFVVQYASESGVAS
jgi:hypothetical protein